MGTPCTNTIGAGAFATGYATGAFATGLPWNLQKLNYFKLYFRFKLTVKLTTSRMVPSFPSPCFPFKGTHSSTVSPFKAASGILNKAHAINSSTVNEHSS